MTREELEKTIKETIIKSLDLEDVSVEEIETDAPLFKDGLGLDSIDAMELGIAVKRKFNLTIKADDPALRGNFFSVKTIADYIEKQQNNA